MPEMDVSENVMMQRLTDEGERKCFKRVIDQRNFWRIFGIAAAAGLVIVMLYNYTP